MKITNSASCKFLFPAVLVTTLCVATQVFSQSDSTAREIRHARIENSQNFDGRRFVNLLETKRKWRFREYIRMFVHWVSGGEIRAPRDAIAVDRPDGRVFEKDISDVLRVFWLGHATTLIEIDGFRVLTDPVWSERVFPLTIAGPARFHRPPIPLEELPHIDAILISHDHYDHLDKRTVVQLARTGAPFYVPLGVGAHLENWGIASNRINELDWWDTASVAGGMLTLVATPARHLSGRGLFKGANKTLWSSWVIVGETHKVFFSGDTGYFPTLKTIGEKYGPFDFTLLAIGAYDDNWPDIHLSPEEAVAAHLDLRGETLIPIHWGTFNLSFHDWFEPPERLIEASKDVRYVIPRPGQAVSSSDEPEAESWWREYMADR